MGLERICITRYNWVFGVKINNYVVLVSKRLGGSVSGPPDTTLRTGIDLSHSVRALYCRRFGVMVVAGEGGGGGVSIVNQLALNHSAPLKRTKDRPDRSVDARKIIHRVVRPYIYIYYIDIMTVLSSEHNIRGKE